jgi:hypothetical protein
MRLTTIKVVYLLDNSLDDVLELMRSDLLGGRQR